MMHTANNVKAVWFVFDDKWYDMNILLNTSANMILNDQIWNPLHNTDKL